MFLTFNVSSVLPTGKFPEKVENLKREDRFPVGTFRAEFLVPFTSFSWFIPVSIVTDAAAILVSHQVMGSAPYRGLRSNGTSFYLSENPFLLPPNFPDFLPKWKVPF